MIGTDEMFYSQSNDRHTVLKKGISLQIKMSTGDELIALTSGLSTIYPLSISQIVSVVICSFPLLGQLGGYYVVMKTT